MNKCKDQGSKVGKKESNSPYGSFYPSTLIACTLNMDENRDEFVNNEDPPPHPPRKLRNYNLGTFSEESFNLQAERSVLLNCLKYLCNKHPKKCEIAANFILM